MARLHRQGPLEDAGGDRRRHRAAVRATLHHDGNRILRVIVGRETGEPRDRVLLPVRHRLRGTGLARHLHVGEPRLPAGAAALVHHFPESAPRQFDLLGREIMPQIAVQFRRLRDHGLPFFIQERMSFAVHHVFHQTRVVGDAAIGYGGVDHRQLQWTHEIEALANRDVGRVGGGPFFARVIDLHPLRARQNSRLLPGHLDPGSLAQTERLARLINRVDPGGVAELVKEGIARNLDRIREAEGAVRPAFLADPALEIVIAVAHAPGAIEVLGAHAFAQSGQRRH